MSTKHLASLLLAIGFATVSCAHTGPDYYECAEKCANDHPTSIGFTRGDCISRCQGKGPKVNRTPGSGSPKSTDATGHVVLDVRVVDLAAEERAATETTN